jgi:hypothetical protein
MYPIALQYVIQTHQRHYITNQQLVLIYEIKKNVSSYAKRVHAGR